MRIYMKPSEITAVGKTWTSSPSDIGETLIFGKTSTSHAIFSDGPNKTMASSSRSSLNLLPLSGNSKRCGEVSESQDLAARLLQSTRRPPALELVETVRSRAPSHCAGPQPAQVDRRPLRGQRRRRLASRS